MNFCSATCCSFLAMTSHVILDEIHERDILSDFLMIIVRDLMLKRPDLKIILMSATLNAQHFASYFGQLIGTISAAFLKPSFLLKFDKLVMFFVTSLR
jgi:HrpA-like RNA helicase